MSSRAFIIAGNRLLPVANPEGAALTYHARAFAVLPEQRVPVQQNRHADTVIAVTEGMVEVMINGAVTLLAAGDFIRIKAGLHFAWRNPRAELARVLQRSCRATTRSPHCWIALNVAAA